MARRILAGDNSNDDQSNGPPASVGRAGAGHGGRLRRWCYSEKVTKGRRSSNGEGLEEIQGRIRKGMLQKALEHPHDKPRGTEERRRQGGSMRAARPHRGCTTRVTSIADFQFTKEEKMEGKH